MDPLTAEHKSRRGAASTTALILGILNFILLIALLAGAGWVWSTNQKWNAVLHELTDQPNLRLVDAQWTGFFNRHLVTWFDGSGNDVQTAIEEALSNNGLRTEDITLTMLPAHLPESSAAQSRASEQEALAEKQAAEIAALSQELAATEQALIERQGIDYERLSQKLLKARFPEEMEDVRIEIDGKRWIMKGAIYEPELATFPSRVAKFLEGVDLDLSEIENKTASRIADLSAALSKIDLSQNDPAHQARAKRLMQDVLWVYARSERSEPQFQLVVQHTSNDSADSLAQSAQTAVTSGEFAVTMDQLRKSERILVDDSPRVSVRVVQIAAAQ